MSFLGKTNLYAKYDVGKTHIPSEQTCVTNVASSNIAFSILGQWKNTKNGNGLQFWRLSANSIHLGSDKAT